MNYIIREALIDDYNDIYIINRNSLGYEYPLDKTKRQLEIILSSNSHKIYVASSNNIVIGYIHLVDHYVSYFDHIKNVLAIAVNNDYKRQGIGSALMKKGEEWAKETGAVGVKLLSSEFRPDAHEFYKKQGYLFKKNQLNFQKNF